ncbi:MAG: DUF4364 family protein [Lachnospiraceae bacterium]|nr:DUF4364 family protein [Lachnospiraceae bacterium]
MGLSSGQSQDFMTLNKLIILYMLSLVDFHLTGNVLADFIVEREYTDYLSLQQALSELADTGFITASRFRNRTEFSLTVDGKHTLDLFYERMDKAIREDIKDYLKKNELSIRNELSIKTEVYRSTSGEYEAHLCAMEKNVKLVDLTLSVPDMETADSICRNWKEKNEEIYGYLTSKLF